MARLRKTAIDGAKSRGPVVAHARLGYGERRRPVLDIQSFEVGHRSVAVRLLSASSLLALTFCAFGAEPVHATKLTSVSPAHCVAALERGEGADLLRCPAPLRLAVAEAQAACREAGGKLTGAAEGDVWAIDVNADRRKELMFALADNVTCADAWKLFSCGDIRCPRQLYELRAGKWTVVGAISAESPEQITLGTTQAADAHHTIEVCTRARCSERSIYEWNGSRYEQTRVESRQGLAP